MVPASCPSLMQEGWNGATYAGTVSGLFGNPQRTPRSSEPHPGPLDAEAEFTCFRDEQKRV